MEYVKFLAYADYINISDENINTIKREIVIMLEASREVTLEVSIDRTKYMVMSRH
jgi:hypothetical protein